MRKPFTLTVKQPCNQSWEEMQPDTSGRFCGACQKHVVDFTSFGDKQFISYFQNYPQPSDLCGKLSEKQLSVIIPPKPAPITFWDVNKLAAASLIAALGFTYKAEAQVKIVVPTHATPPRKVDHTIPEKRLVIKGIVKEERGEGIPGVSITVKGTNKGTVSDMDGKFKLELPERDSVYKLTCTTFGMLTQEITLDGNRSENINVIMKNDANIEIMGAVSIVKTQPTLWQRLIKPFRRK